MSSVRTLIFIEAGQRLLHRADEAGRHRTWQRSRGEETLDPIVLSRSE